jgi:predicted short-subunit dehydrogenase-like oxidoreductase (DUF2520 family)
MQKHFKSNITIIGSGNTATFLSNLMQKAGHRIDAIWSRNELNAKVLAEKCNSISIASLDQIPTSSDFIIIAISDDAIGDVVQNITQHEGIMLHTAGSVSKKVLVPVSNKFGVFYPLQTLRKEMSLNEKLPILIDGNCDEVILQIKQLASSITDLVHIAGDEERLKLHLGAVFVSNFTNHLYQLTYEWCKQSQLSFELLLPIIREMAGRQSNVAPSQWQTGPASRGDRETLSKHLGLLKDHPMMQQVYELMSEDLLARKQKNDELRNLNQHE